MFFLNVGHSINMFYCVCGILRVSKFSISHKFYSSFLSIKIIIINNNFSDKFITEIHCSILKESGIAKIDKDHLKHDIYFYINCLELFLELKILNAFYK